MLKVLRRPCCLRFRSLVASFLKAIAGIRESTFDEAAPVCITHGIQCRPKVRTHVHVTCKARVSLARSLYFCGKMDSSEWQATVA